MPDTIRGRVVTVVDADHFYLKVSRVLGPAEHTYADEELIRALSVRTDPSAEPVVTASKDQLERLITGRVIDCRVIARFPGRHTLADVEVHHHKPGDGVD